jgi:hypothetical protein
MKQLWDRFTSALTTAMSGQSLSGAAQKLSDGQPVPVPTATPSAVPSATPIAMPIQIPPPTAEVVSIEQDGSTSGQKLRAYPVYDGRVIVGFSPTPAASRSPRKDAEALLCALIASEYAGETILASALEEFYRDCCTVAGFGPYPWQLVATELIDLTGGEKPYERVRGVKKRVYKIPDQMAAAVVDNEAARKRA